MARTIRLIGGKQWSEWSYVNVPVTVSSSMENVTTCTCVVDGDIAYVTGNVKPSTSGQNITAFTGLPAPKYTQFISLSGYNNSVQAEMYIDADTTQIKISVSAVPSTSYEFNFQYPLADPESVYVSADAKRMIGSYQWSEHPYIDIVPITSLNVTGACTCKVAGDIAFVSGYVTPSTTGSNIVAFTGLPAPRVKQHISATGYGVSGVQSDLYIDAGDTNIKMYAGQVPSSSLKFSVVYPLDDPTDVQSGSTIMAIINTIYPPGFTCTCTDGTTTLTASDTSGTYAFNLPSAGTWTVSATDGTSTYSDSVITVVGQSYSVAVGVAYIKVNTNDGASVTINLNNQYSQTKTATNGVANFEVNHLGEWTVKSTWDSKEYTRTVTVNAYGSEFTETFTYSATITVNCSGGSSTYPMTVSATTDDGGGYSVGPFTYATNSATITVPKTGTWKVYCTWDGKQLSDTNFSVGAYDTNYSKTFTYECYISVTCPSDAYVIATNAITGYSSVSRDRTGSGTLTVPKAGKWNVTVYLNRGTAGQTTKYSEPTTSYGDTSNVSLYPRRYIYATTGSASGNYFMPYGQFVKYDADSVGTNINYNYPIGGQRAIQYEQTDGGNSCIKTPVDINLTGYSTLTVTYRSINIGKWYFGVCTATQNSFEVYVGRTTVGTNTQTSTTTWTNVTYSFNTTASYRIKISTVSNPSELYIANIWLD